MSTKNDSQNQPQLNVILSKTSSAGELAEGETLQETKIVANTTVPHEGGWGWVVVFTSLLSIALIDGLAFTFGAMFSDLTQDIHSIPSSVAFINAIGQTMYYFQSPLVSAFIHRFGFRAACMTGSIMVSFGLFCTYFSLSYSYILFFYGVITGTGFCFVNVSSLIVGYYFEKLRSLAFSISTCGSSLGIMAFYPINSHIVQVAGWRYLILLHAGLNGLSFFIAMTYRPPLSLSVPQQVDDDHGQTQTVTYLPSLKNIHLKYFQDMTSGIRKEVLSPSSLAERLRSTLSDVIYPTASEVVLTDTSTAQPGPSVALTPHPQTAPGGMSSLQDRSRSAKVKYVMTKVIDMLKILITKIKTSEPIKSCWTKLRTWVKNMTHSRSLYILKKKSFLLVCFSGLFLYVGFTVPYVFLQDRNLSYGLDPQHCAFFVSAIGFTNILGKLIIGGIACKLDPLKLYILVNILSGLSTMLSDVSRTVSYQYFYSCFFGFFISPTIGLRSMVLVNIYGLENLTNASGIALLFQGLGSLISTPAASMIKTRFGDKLTFIWAGFCMFVSGLLLMPVQYLANKETN